jgi:hypothetical protein
MTWYKKFSNWITGLFKDEKGNPSSKRFIGIICGLSLCVSLFINQYTGHKPSDALVDSVALLAFGCLGLSSVDKIWSKKDSKVEENN